MVATLDKMTKEFNENFEEKNKVLKKKISKATKSKMLGDCFLINVCERMSVFVEDDSGSILTSKEGEQFFSGFANVINAMRKCPKLIIGRVQGKAVGGGVGLASATDYCLATKFASIKLSELSIGIGPFVIEPAVSRKMGATAMSQMTINAETFFSPEYAKNNGLYAEVYESVEALDAAVKSLAEKLSNYNLEALREIKTVFWKGTDHWGALLKERAKISGKLVLSDFTKDTLKRFH